MLRDRLQSRSGVFGQAIELWPEVRSTQTTSSHLGQSSAVTWPSGTKHSLSGQSEPRGGRSAAMLHAITESVKPPGTYETLPSLESGLVRPPYAAETKVISPAFIPTIGPIFGQTIFPGHDIALEPLVVNAATLIRQTRRNLGSTIPTDIDNQPPGLNFVPHLQI